MSDVTMMHEIFDSIPMDKIGKISVFRVKDGAKEWLCNHGPDLTLTETRSLYGPGEYVFQAFAPGNRQISGSSGVVQQKIAGPDEDDEEDEGDDDDEDNDDEDNDDDDDDKDAESDAPRARSMKRDPNPTEFMRPVGHQQPVNPLTAHAISLLSQGVDANVVAQILAMASGGAPQPIGMMAQMPQGRPMSFDPRSNAANGAPWRDDRGVNVTALENELEEKREEIRSLKRRIDREKDDLIDTHNQELRRIKSDCEARISALHNEHEDQLRDRSASHRKQLDTMAADHRKAISDLEKSYEENLASLRRRAMSEADMASTPLQAKLNFVEQENRRLTSEVDRLRNEAKLHEEESRKLRKELAERDIEHRRAIQDRDLDLARSEIENQKSSGGGSSENNNGPSKPGLGAVKELIDMVPTIATAMQTFSKLNNGESVTPTSNGTTKPTPAPIRARSTTAVTSPAPSPSPAPATGGAPPFVTPPSSNNGS